MIGTLLRTILDDFFSGRTNEAQFLQALNAFNYVAIRGNYGH